MFAYDFVINKDSNLQGELSKFSSKLESSGLNQEDSRFLSEQVSLCLAQFQKHIALNSAKSLSMNRVLEGSGYRVTIKMDGRNKSILSKLLDALKG